MCKVPVLKPVIIKTKGLNAFKRFIKHFEARKWEIVEDYFLYIPWLDITLKIPKGFCFDAASIPRILWPLLNPTGILLVGSVFHDFGYRYNYLLDDKGNKLYVGAGRKFFDKLIKDITIYINGTYCLTYIAWFMLRLFGWAAWNSRRKENASENFSC